MLGSLWCLLVPLFFPADAFKHLRHAVKRSTEQANLAAFRPMPGMLCSHFESDYSKVMPDTDEKMALACRSRCGIDVKNGKKAAFTINKAGDGNNVYCTCSPGDQCQSFIECGSCTSYVLDEAEIAMALKVKAPSTTLHIDLPKVELNEKAALQEGHATRLQKSIGHRCSSFTRHGFVVKDGEQEMAQRCEEMCQSQAEDIFVVETSDDPQAACQCSSKQECQTLEPCEHCIAYRLNGVQLSEKASYKVQLQRSQGHRCPTWSHFIAFPTDVEQTMAERCANECQNGDGDVFVVESNSADPTASWCRCSSHSECQSMEPCEHCTAYKVKAGDSASRQVSPPASAIAAPQVQLSEKASFQDTSSAQLQKLKGHGCPAWNHFISFAKEGEETMTERCRSECKTAGDIFVIETNADPMSMAACRCSTQQECKSLVFCEDCTAYKLKATQPGSTSDASEVSSAASAPPSQVKLAEKVQTSETDQLAARLQKRTGQTCPLWGHFSSFVKDSEANMAGRCASICQAGAGDIFVIETNDDPMAYCRCSTKQECQSMEPCANCTAYKLKEA